jgi:hypothetical protein
MSAFVPQLTRTATSQRRKAQISLLKDWPGHASDYRSTTQAASWPPSWCRRGRLGSVPDPAQEPEGAVTQSCAPEQGSANDRECHHQFGDGDDLTQHGMQHPDACRGSKRGHAGSD